MSPRSRTGWSYGGRIFWSDGKNTVKPTIAEGTAIRRPIRIREMLSAIRQTGGGTVAVAEDLIVAAIGKLGGLGLYADPASAAASAALDMLHESGAIHPRETTIVLLTRAGAEIHLVYDDVVHLVMSRARSTPMS
jgi:threonine synthase